MEVAPLQRDFMAPEVALIKATRVALVKVLENFRIKESYCEGTDHEKKVFKVPTRIEQLRQLKDSARPGEEFDVLIIGGGSTGAGAALDAVTRGLKTACVEKEDFSSGTSSRSTKLIWGGSRYLVQALISLFSTNVIVDPVRTIKKFSADFKMVLNCHRERKFLLQTQPHLTWWLPIAVPLKSWLIWPPPFGYYPAVVGPLGLFPLFFKFVSSCIFQIWCPFILYFHNFSLLCFLCVSTSCSMTHWQASRRRPRM